MGLQSLQSFIAVILWDLQSPINCRHNNVKFTYTHLTCINQRVFSHDENNTQQWGQQPQNQQLKRQWQMWQTNKKPHLISWTEIICDMLKRPHTSMCSFYAFVRWKLCLWYLTVYPIEYAYGFVVPCFASFISKFFVGPYGFSPTSCRFVFVWVSRYQRITERYA